MIDNKVTFEMVFPIEPYRNFKLGYEGSIEPKETYAEAAIKAFEKVMAAGDKVYAALRLPISSISSGNTAQVSEIQPKESVFEQQSIGFKKEDIESCTELAVLKSYKFVIKNYPEWQALYNEKMEELTNGQS